MTDYEEIGYAAVNGVIAFLVALAFVFIGVCILIFCLSRSRTKSFLEQRTQESYRKANGLYIASIVFTIFITLFTLSGIAGFFTTIFDLLDDPDPDLLVWNIVEIVEFGLAVTALVLGITALAAFGKAKPLYAQLFPPQPVYYNNSTVQGWQYNQRTYYQYPQQGQMGQNPQQGGQPYLQPYIRQNNQPYPQPYSQQYTTQQSYPQNPHQAYQPTTAQSQSQTYTQQTAYSTPQPPAEKMCPHCGVVNDGKNQTCMFCNKPM